MSQEEYKKLTGQDVPASAPVREEKAKETKEVAPKAPKEAKAAQAKPAATASAAEDEKKVG